MTTLLDRAAAQERIGRTRRDHVADLVLHRIVAGVTATATLETGITVGATAIAGETHRVIHAGAQATTMMAAIGTRTGTTMVGTIAGAGT
jgi:hypothetical protein